MELMFAGAGLRRGKPRQSGKFVHQRTQSFNRAADGFRATMQNLERSLIGRRSAFEMPANSLRRERNGRQRVLDFVRHPPRHFAPRGLFLGFQQIRQIFEDQNITESLASMLQRGHGDRGIEAGTMQRDFKLRGGRAHAVGAPQQRLQIFQDLLGKYFAQRGADHDQVRGVRSRRIEHANQGMVDVSDPAIRVQRKNSGGNALQNGLDVLAALFQRDVGRAQFVAGGFDLTAAGFQLLRHAVERPHQVADFVGRADFHAIVQPPARNLLGSFGQRHHRAGHQLGEVQRQPGGRKQHQHGEQEQQLHVGAAHQSALAVSSR